MRNRLLIQRLILPCIALQFAIIQLITTAQYWDAPRNLHWGIYLTEEPLFLLNTPDTYNYINGFMPDPVELAPLGYAGHHGGSLHPWWGPSFLALFALVWFVTKSYTALALVVPLGAAALTFVTYRLGLHLAGPKAGLMAALLLTLFPVFREHAVMGFVEPLSALVITSAAWFFIIGRYHWVGIIGVVTVLGKIDLIPLLLGSIGGAIVASYYLNEVNRPTLRQIAAMTLPPILVAALWIILIYGLYQRSTTVQGGPDLTVFWYMLPLLFEQLLLLPVVPTLFMMALIIVLAGLAFLRPASAQPSAYWLLATIVALDLGITLIYAAMPGASNNARVLIPALPSLCVLCAVGLSRIAPRPRFILSVWLIIVLAFMSTVSLAFQSAQASLLRPAHLVWEELRAEPRGLVLTPDYWSAALYARQPVTWFAHDPVFEANLLGNADHFQQYLAAHPIRYIVLPADEDTYAAWAASLPEVAFYKHFTHGRGLALPPSRLTSPATRAYLDATYHQCTIEPYIIFSTEPLKTSSHCTQSASN